MIDIKLLNKTTQVPGAPGYEFKVRSFITNEIKSYVDDIYTDPMGNLIAVKKGKSNKKVMVAAHMDEISFDSSESYYPW